MLKKMKSKVAVALSLAMASVGAVSPALAGELVFNVEGVKHFAQAQHVQAQGEGQVGITASGEVVNLVHSELPVKVAHVITNKAAEKTYVALASGMGNDGVDYTQVITTNDCALYQIDLQTSGTQCIGAGLLLADLTSLRGDVLTETDQPIQFDAQGNVYFAGESVELGATHQVYQYSPLTGALMTVGHIDNIVGFSVAENGRVVIDSFDVQEGMQHSVFLHGSLLNKQSRVSHASATDVTDSLTLKGVDVLWNEQLPKLKAKNHLYIRQSDKEGDYIGVYNLDTHHFQRLALPHNDAEILSWSFQHGAIDVTYRTKQGIQQAVVHTGNAFIRPSISVLPTPHLASNI